MASILAVSSAQMTQAQTSIELSSLDINTGLVLNGSMARDRVGESMSGVGDFNGDGLIDFILGAPNSEDGALTDVGQAYLMFGGPKSFGGEGSLDSISSYDGFRIIGIDQYSETGTSVSGIGDFNGDGYDDLIIGARNAEVPGGSSAGEAYVIFGGPGPFPANFDLTTLDGTNGFVIYGKDDNDEAGSSVAGAGDVNGDGLQDIIIGAIEADTAHGVDTGEAYIVFGTTNPMAVVELSDIDGVNGVRLRGIDPQDSAGTSVSGAGDVNGDGYEDVIIGAMFADAGGNDEAGEAYVVFGGSSLASPINLGLLAPGEGFRINGEGSGDRLGKSVSGIGDTNGDGYSDVIVGAYRASANSLVFNGSSYVIFGGPSLGNSIDVASLNGTNGYAVPGLDNLDSLGYSVAGAGDMNGDGLSDVIMGAFLATPAAGREGAGKAFVIYGSNSGHGGEFDLNTLNGNNGFVLNGENQNDNAGYSVSAAGDNNGDGLDGVLIGAPAASPGAQADAGTAYLVYGGSMTAPLEATTWAHQKPGFAPPAGIGMIGDGSINVSFVQFGVGFADGSGTGTGNSSLTQVTVTRSKSSITGLNSSEVADVLWEVDTDRTGYTDATVKVHYLDGQIAGLSEARLFLYHSASESGPWEVIPAQTRDEVRNSIVATGVTNVDGFFALREIQNAPTLASVTLVDEDGDSMNPELTDSSTVAIELGTGGGPADTVFVSENSGFSSPMELPFAPRIVYSMVDQNPGAKTLYVRVGNNLGVSGTVSDSITLETDQPSPSMFALASGQASATDSFPIEVEIAFDEPIQDFNADDIDLSGSTTSGDALTASVSLASTKALNAGPYLITINGGPGTTAGDIVVALDDNSILDEAGNPLDSSGVTLTITYNPFLPVDDWRLY